MNNDTIRYLIDLSFQNNKIPMIFNNPFLSQKKSFFENSQEKNYNCISSLENSHFNDFQGYNNPFFGLYSQYIKNELIYRNHSNLNGFELNKYPPKLSYSIGIDNYYLNDNPLNNSIFNNYNIAKNTENINENNNNDIVHDNSNNNINVSFNFPNSHNKKSIKKIFFNIVHVNNKDLQKKLNKNNLKRNENNNEIKIFKNKKIVYANTILLNSHSTAKNIKQSNKIFIIKRNKRGSRYRGVSKNGNQWQVLIMINKIKRYIGSYPSEVVAARIYDIFAIKNRGIKARTNFKYTSKQIKNICEIDLDIKSKNIYEIINQLII